MAISLDSHVHVLSLLRSFASLAIDAGIASSSRSYRAKVFGWMPSRTARSRPLRLAAREPVRVAPGKPQGRGRHAAHVHGLPTVSSSTRTIY